MDCFGAPPSSTKVAKYGEHQTWSDAAGETPCSGFFRLKELKRRTVLKLTGFLVESGTSS